MSRGVLSAVVACAFPPRFRVLGFRGLGNASTYQVGRLITRLRSRCITPTTSNYGSIAPTSAPRRGDGGAFDFVAVFQVAGCAVVVGRSWSVEGLQVRFVCVCVRAPRVSGLWVALPL